MTHPVENLNDDIHQRLRLGIMTVLSGVPRADFKHLKESLGATDGNLGRHLQVLEEAGFVTITRDVNGRRPRSWVEVTPKGRKSLHAEIQILKDIVALVEGTATAVSPAFTPHRDGPWTAADVAALRDAPPFQPARHPNTEATKNAPENPSRTAK